MKTATLKNVKKLIRQNLRWGLLLNKVTGFKQDLHLKMDSGACAFDKYCENCGIVFLRNN